MIKINVLFKTTDNPTGGGNQFLKNLKKWLMLKNHYVSATEADVIIFNSHQYIDEAVKLKKKYPDKIFVHRVAGPIRIQTNPNDKRDNIVYTANKYLGDATVFQSQYSMNENIKYGISRNAFEKIIYNAADVDIFNSVGKRNINISEKIPLVATSWSDNMNKGFDVYKYLDETLDWNKYEMTFVGNSPIKFKHITHKPPMKSTDLAKELKLHDIYLSASKKDPCSNSVIEALACGLPALCLKDGGHPELVKDGGILFEHQEEIPKLLDDLVHNYDKYQKNIKILAMEEVVDEYIWLAEQIKEDVDLGKYHPKSLSFFEARHIIRKVKKWGGQ